MRGRILVCGVALLVGCKQSSPATEQPHEAGSPPAIEAGAASAATPPDAAPAKVVAQRSFASFAKNSLDECVDIALVAPQGGHEQATLEAKIDAMAKKQLKNVVPVKASCEGQFADRVSLASCLFEKDVPTDSGAPVKLAMLSSYYSVRTLDDDAYMRDCLKMGGNWEAAKKDDPEAARERVRQRAKALQDIATKAQGQ